MNTITIRLPEDVAKKLEMAHISPEQLDTFLVAAVKAWLMRRQAAQDSQSDTGKRPRSDAFQDRATTFVDQLIDENPSLFQDLARL